VSRVAELEAGAQITAPAERTAQRRRIDLLKYRNWFFLLSLVIILPGIVSMARQGFLLGIDFAGGTEFFIKFQQPVTLAQVESASAGEGVNATVQQAGRGTFIIRTGVLQPNQQRTFENDLTRKLGVPIDTGASQVNQVGGAVAGETVRDALLAVVGASSLILLYLAFRFRRVPGGWRSGFQFGGSALAALLHDVFLLTGLFSLLGKGIGLLGIPGTRLGEIDSLFLTAVLTVVGFSVHDTIVVFDRIRENLVMSGRLTFEQVANLSIMQTAARSIITSFTVVLVLIALFLFGGDTLRGFSLALLVGIISGTYSSIFNAAPLLVVWKRWAAAR
jgi:preprotein translocase subunit SecF